jgi:hypothetical protein
MSESSRDYLAGSWVVRFCRRAAASAAAWARRMALRSGLTPWSRALLAQWRAAPLRAGGVALIAAVMTHTALSVALGRQPTLGSLVLRAGLLLVGIAGAACGSSWDAVKQGSLVLRFLSRRR